MWDFYKTNTSNILEGIYAFKVIKSYNLLCEICSASPIGQYRYLTRFNKIATQGAPQMAVDKEANSLSRVYSRLLF